MRPNANNRRARGRGGRKSGNTRNQTYDSNGPGARVRGNSSQIYEKYQQLARDAASAGDRVGAENFLQHAEHYYRLMSAAAAKNEQRSGSDDGSQDDASSDDTSREENSRNGGSRGSGNGHGAFVENLQSDDVEDADTRRDDDASDAGSNADAADDSGSPSTGRKRRSRRSNGRATAAGDADSGDDSPDKDSSADDGGSDADDGEAVTA